ncbi:MAG: hypothetical protein HY062_02705 [Bacteroidetes bacterium]|nr:hypothetical protein [Bacteroidota bacterium]
METTIKTNQSKHVTTTKQKNAVSPFWDALEFRRFGIISMLVVVLGCVGGMAASFGAGADALKLGLIALPTIISLALILAVAPMRAIVYSAAIAFVLDLIVLVF